MSYFVRSRSPGKHELRITHARLAKPFYGTGAPGTPSRLRLAGCAPLKVTSAAPTIARSIVRPPSRLRGHFPAPPVCTNIRLSVDTGYQKNATSRRRIAFADGWTYVSENFRATPDSQRFQRLLVAASGLPSGGADEWTDRNGSRCA
jgi:hypothetical protein